MADTFRFGRRVPLPSTRQILHELRVMLANDAAKERAAEEEKQPPGIAKQAVTIDVEAKGTPT
ncbi:MAG: hypothetical protein ABSC72_05005 [Methylovirgula sp.]|jgi:hypothetical protein